MTPPPRKTQKRNAKKAARSSEQYAEALKNRKPRPSQPKGPTKPTRLPKAIPPEYADWIRSMIVYEDDEVYGFNKPAGVSSQGGRGDGYNVDDMTWALAKSSGRRPSLIHRLDRDTSGILLAARSQPAASFLGKAMIAKQFHKTYLAIVENGDVLPDKGRIDAALRREEEGREAWSRVCADDHPDALVAATDFEVLSRHEGAALVRCRPLTGRMHQIRVHLAHLGAPIAGDVRYGGALRLGGVTVPRLMLHALELEFPHPSGGRKTLGAPVPEDMAAVLAAAGLQAGQ